MFERIRLLGLTEQSIIVQTRRGRNIRNVIELDPGEPERRKYDRLVQQYGRYWIKRKPACGAYNCAGHIWASRRTAILEDAEWLMILEDDGYRRLETLEPSASGDLMVYRDRQLGFLHVGVVHELRQGVTEDSPRIPWMLSKWDSTSAEVLHHYQDVPFDKQGFALVIECWTDRPTGESEGQR
jgi:hypothetical protein